MFLSTHQLLRRQRRRQFDWTTVAENTCANHQSPITNHQPSCCCLSASCSPTIRRRAPLFAPTSQTLKRPDASGSSRQHTYQPPSTNRYPAIRQPHAAATTRLNAHSCARPRARATKLSPSPESRDDNLYHPPIHRFPVRLAYIVNNEPDQTVLTTSCLPQTRVNRAAWRCVSAPAELPCTTPFRSVHRCDSHAPALACRRPSHSSLPP